MNRKIVLILVLLSFILSPIYMYSLIIYVQETLNTLTPDIAVTLGSGTAGASQIGVNGTSANVNVTASASLDLEDYVDNDISDVDFSADKGTHGNFSGQQSGPDLIFDVLTEENTGSVESGYKVQQGRTLITSTQQDIPIAEINSLSRAFVIFNHYYSCGQRDQTPSSSGRTNPHWGLVSAYLINTTHIRIERYSAARNIYIDWQVIECLNSEFTVYRGSYYWNYVSGTSFSIDIGNTVTPSNCLAWVVGTTTNQTSREAFDTTLYRAYVSSPTQITIQRSVADPNTEGTLRWIVVEFDPNKIDSIQTGSTTVNNAYTQSSPLQVTLTTPIDPSDSILLFQIGVADSGLSQCSVAGRIANSQTIEFYVHSSSQMRDIRWYVIDFGSNCGSKQSGTIDFSTNPNWYDVDQTLSPTVSLNRTISFTSLTQDGTGTAFGRPFPNAYLENTTNYNIWRSRYGQEAWIEWQILELPYSSGRIVYENSAESYSATGQSSHSFTYPLQKNVGNNRLVVVTVSWEDAEASAAITSLTFGGIAMTKITDVTVGSGYSEYISLWYLLDSDLPENSGSYDVSVTISEAITREIYIAVAEYSGVKQESPNDFDTDANTSPGDTSITLTVSVNGSLIVAAVGEGGTNSLTDTTNIDVLQEQILTSSGSAIGHRINVSSGDITVGWNNLDTREGMVGTVWQPARGNGPYELDLEVQWTNLNYNNPNGELAIYVKEDNNSYSITADGGYMIVGDGTPDWGSTSGTISFWIKWNTVANRTWGQHDNMETRFSGSNLILDWGTAGSLTSSTSFTAGKWYFIAIVWNENTDELYLYVGDQNTPPALDASNTAWTYTVSTVGVTQNNFLASKGGVEPTDGQGDDLRYWDTARPLTEIQRDYNIELTGSEPHLKSYFKLNNNFNDSGPNNDDGSGYGNYSFSPEVPFGTPPTENLQVDVWNGSSWQSLLTDLTNGWNNISVASYLNSTTFTIRFKGANETVDVTQDSWYIDATLLHIWTSGSTYDYVLTINSQKSYNQNIRLKVYNYSNIGRLSNCTIWLHNSNISKQITVNGGVLTQDVGPWYLLPAFETRYIAVYAEESADGTSILFIKLEAARGNSIVYTCLITLRVD